MNTRTVLAAVLFAALFFAGSASLAEAVILAQDGETDYRVVIPADAPKQVRAAADELALFLQQITGATFPIVADNDSRTENEILVGNSSRLKELGVAPDWVGLGREGYVIRTVGNRLVIAGGPWRGTINGVYVFLTDYLGCRWFAPGCSVIPKQDKLVIPAIDVHRVPPFAMRSIWAPTMLRDRDWFIRNHLNWYQVGLQTPRRPDGTREVSYNDYYYDPRLTNAWHYAGYQPWHSLGDNKLLDRDKYFDSHPEYFAMVDGKRLPSEQQPCLTQPDVVSIVIESVRNHIRNNPQAPLADVSLGDYGNMCECPTCTADYQKYGRSGVYVRFVNQIAAAIEKESPQVMLATLCGYPPVQSPPRGGVTLHRNIVVESGNTSYCRFHDFLECAVNLERGKLQTLRNWIPIAPGGVAALLYQYGAGPLLPRSSQYRLLRDNGLTGVYVFSEDGRAREYYRDQTPDLRGYLHARLIWDPEFDVDKGIREFCRAYYGAAGVLMTRYVEGVNDDRSYAAKVTRYEDIQRLPGFHTAGALDPIKRQALDKFETLFNQAEEKVRNDPVALEHVRTDRLPLQYTILMTTETTDPLWRKAAKGIIATIEQFDLKLKRVPNQKAGKSQTLAEFRRWTLDPK